MVDDEFARIYRQSLADPEGFWSQAAADIAWFAPPPGRIFEADGDLGTVRWFPGARTNTCYNCVDRHVDSGRGGQAAIVYDSPMTGVCARITYADLQGRVARFAGVLRARGVAQGDRVIVYMPMIPEALIAMLACARLGAVHSVVFGGFAPRELAARIADCEPRAIVTASCGLEPGRVISYVPLVREAVRMSGVDIAGGGGMIVWQREQAPQQLESPYEIDWQAAEADAEWADCVGVLATDPLYILYTSGTTGQPKGVVRDNGGHMVALKWSMGSIYGVSPGEVFWAASDVGWVVGHSYIVYAPLLHGCTTVVFEGKPVGTPDAAAFWRVISAHGVSVLFTAPTAFRAIKRKIRRLVC